jgi:hypothetical protein
MTAVSSLATSGRAMSLQPRALESEPQLAVTKTEQHKKEEARILLSGKLLCQEL